MAKKSMILKQQAPAKFSTRRYNRCKICGRPHVICATTASAVSASANWLIKDRSRVLKKQAGKTKATIYCEIHRRNHTHDYERSNCRYAYKNP